MLLDLLLLMIAALSLREFPGQRCFLCRTLCCFAGTDTNALVAMLVKRAMRSRCASAGGQSSPSPWLVVLFIVFLLGVLLGNHPTTAPSGTFTRAPQLRH